MKTESPHGHMIVGNKYALQTLANSIKLPDAIADFQSFISIVISLKIGVGFSIVTFINT